MTVEQRLRDAMQARVAPVDAPALAARVERPRRVWPVVAAWFAIVVVLALVVALVARGDGGGSVQPAARASPRRIVAVTTDGRVILASSKDGHALRTLASGALAGGGLAVSPDGRTVYYAEIEQVTCPGDPVPVTRIMAVPVRGGTPQEIATNVRYPTVSPDGRYLAFTGIPNCSDAGQSVLVKDLQAGARSTEPYDRSWGPQVFAGTTQRGIGGLSWAPDSRHLLFTWFDAPGGQYTGVLDTRAPSTTFLDTSPRVKTAVDTTLCCYLGTRDTLVATVIAQDLENTWTADPRSGRLLEHLSCCGTVVATDRDGAAFLTYWTDPTHPGGLYRWTLGDRHRVFLGSLLATAVWVPEADAAG